MSGIALPGPPWPVAPLPETIFPNLAIHGSPLPVKVELQLAFVDIGSVYASEFDISNISKYCCLRPKAPCN